MVQDFVISWCWLIHFFRKMVAAILSVYLFNFEQNLL